MCFARWVLINYMGSTPVTRRRFSRLDARPINIMASLIICRSTRCHRRSPHSICVKTLKREEHVERPSSPVQCQRELWQANSETVVPVEYDSLRERPFGVFAKPGSLAAARDIPKAAPARQVIPRFLTSFAASARSSGQTFGGPHFANVAHLSLAYLFSARYLGASEPGGSKHRTLPMCDDAVPFCGSARFGCPSIDDGQRFLRQGFETELQEQQSVRCALDETPLPDGVGLYAGQPRQEMAAAPPKHQGVAGQKFRAPLPHED